MRAEPPITGRAGERGVLLDAVRRAAAGSVQVVAIGGEPGIGKTRLAREGLALAAEHGFTVLTGAAGPLDRDLSLAPVVEALRPLVGAGTALGDGLADLARLFDGLPVPTPADLGDPGLERTRLFEAVRRLLDRTARRAPVGWLLDDAHWADPATLGLVQYLARGLAGRPFLLLLTHRTGSPEVSAAPLLAVLRRSPGFTELGLRGLAERDVAGLAAALLDAEPPPALVELLVERCGGVPLFVTGMVQALTGSGALRRGPDGWTLDRAPDVPLPAAAAELLGERVDALPDPARAVLDVLAVSPGALRHDVLAAVLDDEQAVDGVTGLHRAGLLAEEDGPDGVAYRVVHPVLAEVAHARLPTVTRRRLHARIARAVAAAAPADLSRQAHHVRGAGAALPADQALAVLLPAAEAALHRNAGEEAAADATAALDRLPDDDDRRPALHETLATGAEMAGDSATAVEAWLAAALAGPAGTERALRLRKAALPAWNLGRFDQAWQVLDDADAELAGAEQAGGAPAPARLAVQESRLALAGRTDDARLAAELDRLEALVATIGSPRARLLQEYAAVVLMIRRGDLDAAAPQVDRLYAMADATGDDLFRERVRRPGAQVAFQRGDLDRAVADSRAGLDLVARIGVPTLGSVHLLYLAYIALLRGDQDGEQRWLAGLGELAHLGRFDRGVVLRHALVALGRVRRGRPDEGLAFVEQIRAEQGHWAASDRHAFSPIEYVECLALLQAGDAAAARAVGEHNLARGSALQHTTLEAVAEACLRSGDAAAARVALDRLRPIGPGSPWPAASVRRVEALLAAHDGDPAAAAAGFDAAADGFAAIGLALESASCRLDAATARLDAGTADDRTQQAVAAALLAVERIGAVHEADRARSLLRRLGVRPAPRSRARPATRAVPGGSAAPAGLSPREAEVARLVAEGLSNAEVSQRLFISPRTVTTHLQNIYARLGVGSRTALAKYVLDQPPTAQDT